MCKRVAQDRDGADFKEYDTDSCHFEVGVEKFMLIQNASTILIGSFR